MSKPRHRAYVAIEDSMMAAVRAAVETRAKKLMSEVRRHIADGKFGDAHKAVEQFTLEPAVAASRTKFKTLAVSAMLFGASRHKPVAETRPAKEGKVGHLVDTAITQLSNMLVHNATLRVRAAAMILLHEAEDQAKQALLKSFSEDEVERDEKGQFASAARSSDDIETEVALRRFSDESLPDDTDKYQYFYHSTRTSAETDSIAEGGLKLGASGKIWFSRDEIRDRGGGYVVVRVPTGSLAEGVDRVEAGLSYREFTSSEAIPAKDVVKVVRSVDTGGGHYIREDQLARYALDNQGLNDADVKALPEKYRAWFNLQKSVQSIAKADLTPDEIAAALETAIMNNTRMIADVGANLVTSRLASYGFLAEANNDGVSKFMVSEVLDEATCPVCQAMDGRVFEVDKALARVELALSMEDPEELKIAAPWPDQSEEGVAELNDSTAEELQAMGYDCPPFHPGCRGILVTVADEELAETTKPITVLPEDASVFDDILSIEEFEALSAADKKKAIAAGIAPED